MAMGLGSKNQCAGEGQQQFAELDWTVYNPIVARQLLGKHVPATTKNGWRRRFLCGTCRVKGK
jgi:hypothetical protein